jgi:hypothetical protein
MFALDLCNDCHQNVGIPCILVYLLYVKGVSYLVGKPFIPLFFLSEKLCGLCWRSVKMLICSVLLKMCGCILQMSENRRRGGRRAQQERPAQQDEAPQQQQLPPPPPMSIEQMFQMQTQTVQAIGQTLAAIQQQQQRPPP